MNSIRVIFVDDEPRVLEGLKRMLRPKRNEWQMTFVGSAQAALEALRAEPCEVVVTDMRMPGMSGAELLEVVQREYPDTIRLILSGQAETESVMKALGVSHQFLSKPCDAEILQGTISRAFALRDLAGNSAVKTLVARIDKLPTLPAIYHGLVRSVATRPGREITQNARLFAAVTQAQDDALIAVFDAKYHYGFWRPVTAIPNGDTDGNDATERDAGWLPLIDTPMHPEYPCAHCIIAASTGAVLKAEIGNGPVGTLTTSSYLVRNSSRSWSSVDAFVAEVQLARIYDGVHYRTSAEVGAAMGKQVGELVVARFAGM